MIEKITAWIVKIGLWFLPILPLYITTGMLFPFITGKNFVFRIIVEIIFALWVGLAILREDYRPRLTPLFKAVSIFIAILFLADLFGSNPARSFFSNYERMEGFMMLSHLYLYFVMLAGMFKSRRDWMVFLHISLFTSLAVAIGGLLQKLGLKISLQGGYRVDSTIGNPAYLAAYLSFHVWMLLILIRRFWANWWLRVFYVVALVFEIAIIYYTATRGALLALTFGTILLLAGCVAFWKLVFPTAPPSYRKGIAALLGIVVAAPIVFWIIRDASFIRGTPVLNRLATISLSDRTTQARFSIWKMSLKGALERPILGWGQENYYLVFQKYFDPKLWSSEPWFDRSHNIFLDWLVHAGILGLASYLSIMGIALWGIMRAGRRLFVTAWEAMVLGVLFISHFFQNLFVFDNLNTYLLFFGFLAYAEYAGYPGAQDVEENRAAVRRQFGPRACGISAALLIVVLVGGYVLHYKPMKESNVLLRALSIVHVPNTPIAEIETLFREALSYKTFGDTEVREQLGNMARDFLNNGRFSQEERTRFAAFAVDELRKEVAQPARDIKHMIFLASILARAAETNPAYIMEAEKILRDAIALSPSKQILYFELAQLYLAMGQKDKAFDTLRAAVKLDPSYPQATVNFLIAARIADQPDMIREARTYIVLGNLGESDLLRVGTLYQQIQDFSAAKEVFGDLVLRYPAQAQYHATFAALLAQLGDKNRAISEAEEAMRLDPAAFGEEAKRFIELLKQGKL